MELDFSYVLVAGAVRPVDLDFGNPLRSIKPFLPDLIGVLINVFIPLASLLPQNLHDQFRLQGERREESGWIEQRISGTLNTAFVGWHFFQFGCESEHIILRVP